MALLIQYKSMFLSSIETLGKVCHTEVELTKPAYLLPDKILKASFRPVELLDRQVDINKNGL